MSEVVGAEEGDKCNRDGCTGKLDFTKSQNCSCHIDAPCGSCMEVKLYCPVCDWESEEKP